MSIKYVKKLRVFNIKTGGIAPYLPLRIEGLKEEIVLNNIGCKNIQY